MIRELDVVVLNRDVGDARLKKGDIGTVVHVYADGRTFEVEFATAEARTVALLTLTSDDVRSMRAGEIMHARELAEAS